MKKNKILYVATVDSHIKSFHLPYLKMMHDKGWEVHVATNGKEKFPYCDKKHTICMERSPFKLNNLKAIKQMKGLLKKEHFDIIHCHTPIGSAVTRLAARKARNNGTKVIYTAHGFHFYTGAPLLNWVLFYPIEKYLSNYTDTIITINQEDYNRAKKKFSKHCSDIQYIPGVGIDSKKFNFKMSAKEKHEIRKQLGLKDDDYVIIFPARLEKNKNQSKLISCMPELTKKHPNLHLLLPGNGKLLSQYKRLAKEKCVEKNVHFLGYRNDIPKLLKISNLIISSSKREGLPIILIEAGCLGLPIVASDCRGNRDVCEKMNGLLVKNGGDKDYVMQIENAIKNKTRSKFDESYEINNILKQFSKIYDKK